MDDSVSRLSFGRSRSVSSRSMPMMVIGICTLNESSGKLKGDGEERAKSMRFIVGRSASEDHTRQIWGVCDLYVFSIL